jgi:thiol-disulfide isomerase/thioredoxin
MSLVRSFFLTLTIIIVLASVTLWTLKPKDHSDDHNPAPLELKVGAEIPDLELVTLNGEKTKLSTIQKSVTLINFWATWCPPCLNEIPSLIRLQEKFKDQGLEIILINVEENAPELAPPVLKDLGFDRLTFYDPEQKIGNLFQVSGLPLSVIIDHTHKILAIESGDKEWDHPQVLEQMTKWIKQSIR